MSRQSTLVNTRTYNLLVEKVKFQSIGFFNARGRGIIVFELGKKGLEPLTLRLSGAYSYLLSYLPLGIILFN